MMMGNESNNCKNCGLNINGHCTSGNKCVVDANLNFRTGRMEPGIPSEWVPKVSNDFTNSFKKYLNERFGVSSMFIEDANKLHDEKSLRNRALNLMIKRVVFNAPATIVFWTNGDKTVVKCGKDDTFDPEKGLAMAISKYFFGNYGFYYDVFKKYLPKEQEDLNEKDH